MRGPFPLDCAYSGNTLYPDVRICAAATPAAFTASTTRVWRAALSAPAFAADSPCDSTATLTIARSGTIRASPMALAEMYGGAPGGEATPVCATAVSAGRVTRAAKAMATATRTTRTTRTARTSLVMDTSIEVQIHLDGTRESALVSASPNLHRVRCWDTARAPSAPSEDRHRGKPHAANLPCPEERVHRRPHDDPPTRQRLLPV